MNKQSLIVFLTMTMLVPAALAEMPPVISVVSASEKSVDPDLISLNVEVWSKAPTAKAAQGLASQEYKRVKQAFDLYKIQSKDIQTLQFSLNPEYVYEPKSQQNKIVGYRSIQIVKVTLRKVDEGGALIDSLSIGGKSTNAGVNVNSIAWDTSKQESLTAEALTDAVKSARQKAEEIAKAAGVKIKSVYRITHGGAGGVEPFVQARGGFAKAMSMAESAPTELSSGQVKVRVEVQAEFEIQ